MRALSNSCFHSDKSLSLSFSLLICEMALTPQTSQHYELQGWVHVTLCKFLLFSSLLFRRVSFLQDSHFSTEGAAYNLIDHLIPNNPFAVAVHIWHGCTALSTINVTCDRYCWLWGRRQLWPRQQVVSRQFCSVWAIYRKNLLSSNTNCFYLELNLYDECFTQDFTLSTSSIASKKKLQRHKQREMKRQKLNRRHSWAMKGQFLL